MQEENSESEATDELLCFSIGSGDYADNLLATVNIACSKVMLKIDTGADCNVMALKVFNSL